MTDPTGKSEILDGLATPHPPPGLRTRTLAAAHRAAVQPSPSGWRAVAACIYAQPAWAAALVILLLAHLAFGFFLEGARPGTLVAPRDEEVAAQPDILRLPQIRNLAHEDSTMRLDRADSEGEI